MIVNFFVCRFGLSPLLLLLRYFGGMVLPVANFLHVVCMFAGLRPPDFFFDGGFRGWKLFGQSLTRAGVEETFPKRARPSGRARGRQAQNNINPPKRGNLKAA